MLVQVDYQGHGKIQTKRLWSLDVMMRVDQVMGQIRVGLPQQRTGGWDRAVRPKHMTVSRMKDRMDKLHRESSCWFTIAGFLVIGESVHVASKAMTVCWGRALFCVLQFIAAVCYGNVCAPGIEQASGP